MCQVAILMHAPERTLTVREACKYLAARMQQSGELREARDQCGFVPMLEYIESDNQVEALVRHQKRLQRRRPRVESAGARVLDHDRIDLGADDLGAKRLCPRQKAAIAESDLEHALAGQRNVG